MNPRKKYGVLENPYILTIHMRIMTHYLSLPRLEEEQESRLIEMKRMKDSGFSTTEISDHFNKKYKKTIYHDKKYTKKLIWVQLDKYEKRLKRLNTYFYSYESVDFLKIH
jgi:hypothetical protein